MKVSEQKLPGGVKFSSHLDVAGMLDRMSAEQRGRLRKVIEEDEAMNDFARRSLLDVMDLWEKNHG